MHRSRPAVRAFVALSAIVFFVATSGVSAAAPLAGLDFEAAEIMPPMRGWMGGPASTLFIDSTVVHAGRYAGRSERTAESPSTFSSFTRVIPADFTGKSVELRGWLKAEHVEEWVGLWLRVDGENGALQFDNMESRRLTGTFDWQEFRVTLPLPAEAKEIYFGALLGGTGRLWVDDVALYADGAPVDQAPLRTLIETVLDRDKEFDGGSRIALTAPTRVQVENLVRLGKVWGYLKYHHPAVTAGGKHWDYELFRVSPDVIAAKSPAAANAAMLRWIEGLGAVEPCRTCPPALGEVAMRPRLTWLADARAYGKPLTAKLAEIHGRRVAGAQFYVALRPNVANPDFSRELAYPKLVEPDPGHRLLALYRFWNIIEYWFPYREEIGEDWDGVLAEFVPRLLGATTRDDYESVMMQLVAHVHDTHANLWSSMDVQPPRGTAQVAMRLRFVEDRPVVTQWVDPSKRPAGFEIGDVIVSVDGQPVSALIERWRPCYAASTEAARRRDLARNLLRGDAGPATLEIEREGRRITVPTERVTAERVSGPMRWWDVPGPTVRRLSDELAYLKLSSVAHEDVPRYLETVKGARGLVIDIRNYPSAFVVFALGNHLVAKESEFARFTNPMLAHPGAFEWTPPVSLTPTAPRFEGRIAILADESSLSQAEYTTMAFRVAPGAIVVGSTTAGADGNVSSIPLPGGERAAISGIGVFYPDQRPTQRIGIVPDVEARPTIAGIRAGRDEVLEAAVKALLARDLSPAEREALASPGPAAATPAKD